jgi:hypothetical protein
MAWYNPDGDHDNFRLSLFLFLMGVTKDNNTNVLTYMTFEGSSLLPTCINSKTVGSRFLLASVISGDVWLVLRKKDKEQIYYIC